MARSETEISSPFPLFHYRIHKIKNLNMKLEKGKKTTVLEKVKGGLSLSLFVSFASKKKGPNQVPHRKNNAKWLTLLITRPTQVCLFVFFSKNWMISKRKDLQSCQLASNHGRFFTHFLLSAIKSH